VNEAAAGIDVETSPQGESLAPADTRALRAQAARERKCIVSGEVLPEAKLVRFAADPEARVVPDVTAKLPGRGMWVSANREAIAKAAAKNLFSRAAQTPLKAEVELADRVEALLVAQIQGWLGLARRAGELVLGFDVIERTLRGGKAVLVIVEAADAGEDGRRKLQDAAESRGLRPFVLGALTRDELGLALGRGNVVHAALTSGQKSGSLAERLISDAGRLAGFRPLNPWVWKGVP
jgi:hypothetical protein